jgi:4-methyl-5(b-hydroxyethyl)-thiazole monophosphate biosynthesis
MAKVVVPLAEGFEEIEAVSIVDILRRGGVEANTVYLRSEDQIDALSAAGAAMDMVLGANGITVRADMPADLVVVDEYDAIVLPGGWGGTNRLTESSLIQSLLKEFSKKEKWIAAMCAAPYALHVAGVLSKRYTCYPSVEEQIRPADRVADEKVVVDGKVITSQGPGTAICFALEILNQIEGKVNSETVKNGTLSFHC